MWAGNGKIAARVGEFAFAHPPLTARAERAHALAAGRKAGERDSRRDRLGIVDYAAIGREAIGAEQVDDGPIGAGAAEDGDGAASVPVKHRQSKRCQSISVSKSARRDCSMRIHGVSRCGLRQPCLTLPVTISLPFPRARSRGKCASIMNQPTRAARIEAETLGLRALTFVIGEDDLRPRLLEVTGLDVATLRSRAGHPALLAATLAFLEAHEPSLLACAAALDIDPAQLTAARATLDPRCQE